MNSISMGVGGRKNRGRDGQRSVESWEVELG